MSEPVPTVGRYRDSDGRVHHAAPGSEWVTKGLAAGDLTDLDAPAPEVPNATSVPDTGDDSDTSGVRSRSGQRQRTTPAADSGTDDGMAGATAGR